MLTVADLKAAIRARGYATDTAGEQLIMLNSMQRDVLGDHRYRFMLVELSVAAVAATPNYTLAPTPPVHHIEAVSFTDSGGQALPIVRGNLDELDAFGVDGYTPDGRYRWAELQPGKLRIFPAPAVAGTLLVRYSKEAATLSADGDTPTIPAPYLDVLVAGVCELLAMRERQPDAVGMFGAEKERRLRSMQSQYGLKKSSPRLIDSGANDYARFNRSYYRG